MRRRHFGYAPLVILVGLVLASCGQSDRDRYLRSRAAVYQPSGSTTAVATVPE